MPPDMWSVTCQWNNQTPTLSGRISITSVVAGKTTTVSIRAPRRSTVLPCQWAVWISFSLPRPMTYQRARSPRRMVSPSRLPKSEPLMACFLWLSLKSSCVLLMPSGEPEPMKIARFSAPSPRDDDGADQTSINVDAFMVVHMVKPATESGSDGPGPARSGTAQ